MGDGKIEDNPKILSGPVLTNSPNAVLSKTLLNRYKDLPLPADKILATYIWIDGTGEHLRCKDRTLNFIPKVAKVDMLTRTLQELNKKWKMENYCPSTWINSMKFLPFALPKDLENVFEVRCKLRERENRDSFDENLKGFTPSL